MDSSNQKLCKAPLGPCPWGKRSVKLNSNDLKGFQKDWIGRALASKLLTAKQCMQRFNLPRRTLYNYRINFKNGKRHVDGRGKPSYLVKESKKHIIDYVNEGTMNKTT